MASHLSWVYHGSLQIATELGSCQLCHQSFQYSVSKTSNLLVSFSKLKPNLTASPSHSMGSQIRGLLNHTHFHHSTIFHLIPPHNHNFMNKQAEIPHPKKTQKSCILSVFCSWCQLTSGKPCMDKKSSSLQSLDRSIKALFLGQWVYTPKDPWEVGIFTYMKTIKNKSFM